jgi:galactofuranosylgalactofuranosylrhamnosyl-N-acetylglucosaminyl-diphospho-decaprenol beta-1,5/1,6-galactofuranosyltransferase
VAEAALEGATDGSDAAPPATYRVVQRTILRGDQELDIRPLYIGGVSSIGGSEEEGRQSGSYAEADSTKRPDPDPSGQGDGAEAMGSFGHVGEAGAVVLPERRMTFGTYFNAFPASYWRRWSDHPQVRLTVVVSGRGTAIVNRSTAKGHVLRQVAAPVSTSEPVTLEFDLPLKPFIDGGWYWFDIEAGDSAMTLHRADWSFATDKVEPGTVSIGITTVNRQEFCVDQLLKLADQPEVLERIEKVYVIDQGTQLVRDYADYPLAAERLGDRLQLIEQANLGGSGGFSRSMDEAANHGNADYVLLLDDDVVCEPEGILRAIAFADLARRPTIVGGHMFSLYDRSVLHTFGEKVAAYRWFWGPAPNTYHSHNFARRPLRSTRWLHRRVDVDYNGWWMCLIPTAVVRELGLAAPMFIKWDDAEFGLRAGEAGYPTVSLPGVAVWHVPWHEKDDTIDWQAYFHRRNRIIAALLYSPYPHGGRLIWESYQTQVKHLLSMQYGPAEMGLMALEDILDGPQRMHRDNIHRFAELRALRATYDDSISKPDLEDFPTPRRKRPPRRGKEASPSLGRLGRGKALVAATLRQALPVRDLSRAHPETRVTHGDSRWFVLANYDSALVSSADGTSTAWYKRHPDQFRELLARSSVLHSRLYNEWPRLVEEYRSALPDITSPKAWHETFELTQEPSGATSPGTGGAT